MQTKNHCPRCHTSNQCAIAKGQTIEQCWCMHTALPQLSSSTKLLLPDIEQGCLCATCWQTLAQIDKLAKPVSP